MCDAWTEQRDGVDSVLYKHGVYRADIGYMIRYISSVAI